MQSLYGIGDLFCSKTQVFRIFLSMPFRRSNTNAESFYGHKQWFRMVFELFVLTFDESLMVGIQCIHCMGSVICFARKPKYFGFFLSMPFQPSNTNAEPFHCPNPWFRMVFELFVLRFDGSLVAIHCMGSVNGFARTTKTSKYLLSMQLRRSDTNEEPFHILVYGIRMVFELFV